jgi:hypothetical protein
MKNTAQENNDIRFHFAIEQMIMDLVDNGTPREEIKRMMSERHPMIVGRVAYYMELWNTVKAELDSATTEKQDRFIDHVLSYGNQ